METDWGDDRLFFPATLYRIGDAALEAFLECRRLRLSKPRDIEARSRARGADPRAVDALVRRRIGLHYRTDALLRTTAQRVREIGAEDLVAEAVPVGAEIPGADPPEIINEKHLYRRALRALADDVEELIFSN